MYIMYKIQANINLFVLAIIIINIYNKFLFYIIRNKFIILFLFISKGK